MNTTGHGIGNWEIESPDGSLKVTRNQLEMAHAVYDQLDWTTPPLSTYKNHPDGPTSAMAGCLGGVMGMTEIQTTDTYESNVFFRQLVEAQLFARELYARMAKAQLS